MYRYHPYFLAAMGSCKEGFSLGGLMGRHVGLPPLQRKLRFCSLLVNLVPALAHIPVRRGSWNSPQLPVLGHKDPRKGPSGCGPLP